MIKPWWTNKQIMDAHIEWEDKYGRDPSEQWGQLWTNSSVICGEVTDAMNNYALSVPLIKRLDIKVSDYVFFPQKSGKYSGWIAKIIGQLRGDKFRASPDTDRFGNFKFSNSIFKIRIIDHRFPEMAGWEKPGSYYVEDTDGGFKEVQHFAKMEDIRILIMDFMNTGMR